ncbi:DUF4752 family protein [Edwardsiella piscicida]|uniref:DUF4752 family protein n=1 Tax=Edwardsiella piscicida TaxID=1263550 RepID=UPI0024799165|nr:DUF4752 family protein [Edwardsiella piscicida]WGS75575.1 DUF4752 family protein [Edwardsiella piscicida]WGS78964.1 DUF4752 family protein [Edwardsiella piscicida]
MDMYSDVFYAFVSWMAFVYMVAKSVDWLMWHAARGWAERKRSERRGRALSIFFAEFGIDHLKKGESIKVETKGGIYLEVTKR